MWRAFGFEVYCGKRQMQDDSAPSNEKSGPAAVVRNLQHVFGPTGPAEFRLGNKQGLCEATLPPKLKNGRSASNKRPAHIERGTYEVATSVHVPAMKAIRWYDNQGAHV
ncbi:hypothetical protein PC128_g3693 [Phytophthora cactorum]|nr:hypothetical protein PC128_g3693 [Phytophthora cactorum]